MSEFNQFSIVHIDDNIDHLMDTARILMAHPSVKVVHQARNAVDGLELIQTIKPNIAIIDLEMPGKDGFWLAHQIKSSPTAIVFLTSNNDMALKAFDFFAIHYLMKPLEESHLDEILERFLRLNNVTYYQEQQIEALLASQRGNLAIPHRVFINTQREIKVINLSELVYVEAEGAYTTFYLMGEENIRSSRNLKSFTPLLSAHPDFKRVHKSYIVNQNFLDRIEKNGSHVKFIFKDGREIDMATFRKDAFFSSLIT